MAEDQHVAAGALRVLTGLAQGLAKGECDSAELSRVNAAAWITLLIGGVLGFAAAPAFGLTGLLCGVAFGWLLRAALIVRIAWRHL